MRPLKTPCFFPDGDLIKRSEPPAPWKPYRHATHKLIIRVCRRARDLTANFPPQELLPLAPHRLTRLPLYPSRRLVLLLSHIVSDPPSPFKTRVKTMSKMTVQTMVTLGDNVHVFSLCLNINSVPTSFFRKMLPYQNLTHAP